MHKKLMMTTMMIAVEVKNQLMNVVAVKKAEIGTLVVEYLLA